MLSLLFAERSFGQVIFALVGLTVVGLFALMAKLLPYTPRDYVFPTTRSKEDLAEEYRKWEVAAIIPYFLFTALSVLLLWGLYLGLQKIFYALLPEGSLFFPCMAMVFLLPAMIQGLLLSAIPTVWLYKYLLGERYAEYDHYTHLRVGFNAWRLVRWMAIGVAVITIPFLIVMFDCYLRATPAALYDNPPLSFGEIEIPYAEIDEIQKMRKLKAPNGNIKNDPYTRIRYRKESVIDLERGALGLTSAQVQSLIDYIQKQRAVPIKQYEFAPE